MPDTFFCSFCGKSQTEVEQMIAGPDKVFICDECVGLLAMIVLEKRHEMKRTPAWAIPRASD